MCGQHHPIGRSYPDGRCTTHNHGPDRLGNRSGRFQTEIPLLSRQQALIQQIESAVTPLDGTYRIVMAYHMIVV